MYQKCSPSQIWPNNSWHFFWLRNCISLILSSSLHQKLFSNVNTLDVQGCGQTNKSPSCCLQCFNTVCSASWKKWVMRCWRGYMSGATCKWFAYGPAYATATWSYCALLECRTVYIFFAPAYTRWTEKRTLNGYLYHAMLVTHSW